MTSHQYGMLVSLAKQMLSNQECSQMCTLTVLSDNIKGVNLGTPSIIVKTLEKYDRITTVHAYILFSSIPFALQFEGVPL